MRALVARRRRAAGGGKSPRGYRGRIGHSGSPVRRISRRVPTLGGPLCRGAKTSVVEIGLRGVEAARPDREQANRFLARLYGTDVRTANLVMQEPPLAQ
jgi:hypothetical protein